MGHLVGDRLVDKALAPLAVAVDKALQALVDNPEGNLVEDRLVEDTVAEDTVAVDTVAVDTVAVDMVPVVAVDIVMVEVDNVQNMEEEVVL